MLLPKAAAGPLEKWGRLETDKESGALRLPAWGATSHWTMPWVDWAYAYILGAGDQTWHGLMAPVGAPRDGTPLEESLEKLSKKTIPYTDDIFMFNYAWKGEEAWKTGIYSPHKAKQVAWSRHFTGFWNESMAFCEMFLPELGGDSPEIEMMYYKAVTGKEGLVCRHHANWPEDLDPGARHPRDARKKPADGRLLPVHVQAGSIGHGCLRRRAHLRERQMA